MVVVGCLADRLIDIHFCKVRTLPGLVQMRSQDLLNVPFAEDIRGFDHVDTDG